MKSKETSKSDSPFDRGKCVRISKNIFSLKIIHLLNGKTIILVLHYQQQYLQNNFKLNQIQQFNSANKQQNRLIKHLITSLQIYQQQNLFKNLQIRKLYTQIQLDTFLFVENNLQNNKFSLLKYQLLTAFKHFLTIFLICKIQKAISMYTHPQQPIPGQPVRYSTSAQQQPVTYNSYPASPPIGNPNTYPHPISYPQQTTHSHVQQYQVNTHQVYNQNVPRSSHQAVAYGQQHFPQQNAALIQPPALNVEETIDTNSQFFPQRAPMTVSNNQHSQFDAYHNQQQDVQANEAQIASMFWQQKCMTMLYRFDWFYQRFQILRNDYATLSDEMQKMDSEQEWHNFQQHHDQFHQKIAEMEQELSAVIGQNEQLLQQKRVQDGEVVWQQRYQELLGNFKSLQEEMQHMEQNGNQGGSGGVPPQQYQQLEEQYNELEYQYNNVVNQLQKTRGNDGNSNQHSEELENYKMKLDSLHNENVELQHMILELEDKTNQYEHHLQNMVDRSKFEELAGLIQQKQQEIQKLQQDFKQRTVNQASIGQNEAALQAKNKQIQQMQQVLSQRQNQVHNLQQQVNQGKQKLQNLEVSLKKSFAEQFDKEKNAKQKRIAQLQHSIQEVNKKILKDSESSFKIQNLQKKLSYSSQQISNLNENLKKKNQQLIQLRSVTFQVEKLKQHLADYNRVESQRDKAIQSLKKKNIEIQGVYVEIQRLTAKFQEVNNKRQQYSTRNLMAQIQDLEDQIRRQQAQIVKLKNIIGLKEDYAQRLQEDFKKVNEKYITTQQILITERQNWKEKQLRFNTKSSDNDKRLKNLDYEFNLQIKETLQREVATLRKQNVQKQDNIRLLQQKQLLLSSQIAVFQKQKNNYDRDLSLIRKKQSQLQSLNENQARRLRELEAAYLAKEGDLQSIKINQISFSSQVNGYKMQIQEHGNLIKVKNKTIQDLQKQINLHLSRSQAIDQLKNQNGKLKVALKGAQEELQIFRMQGESRLGKSKLYESSISKKQFAREESNLVNNLQQENQYLKNQISKMFQKFNVSQSNQREYQPKSQKKLVAVDLNKRLSQFNNKLQQAINGNQIKNSLAHSRSQKLASNWESERKQLIQKYQYEINQLKNQIKSVRVSLNSQKTQQHQIGESSRKIAYNHLENQQLREQLIFFRQKYNEQQQRNQKLVKINEELKQKFQSILKLKQSSNTNQYFKEHNKQLEKDLESLKSKVRKLSEENRELKKQLSSKNSKLSQQYELKILEMDLVVQEQLRKINYLSAERVSANNEKANMVHNFNINNLDRQKDTKPNNYVKYNAYNSQSPKVNIESPKANIESPKGLNIEQQFQSVLGNLRGTNSIQNQGFQYTSQMSYQTYVDGPRSRLQKV